MPDEQNYTFDFKVSGQSADTFGVVAFTGLEALNEPYRFDITLASQNKSISPDAIIQQKATLQLQGVSESLKVSGVVQTFTQVRFVKNLAIYRAVLVPALANLKFIQQNQIFLNMAMPDMLEQILKDGKIDGYETRFRQNYPTMEYACQFNETHLDFLTRWLEHRGAYYYFDQSGDVEKCVLVDSSMAHTACTKDKLLYSPPSNLDDPAREHLVKSLVVEHTSVPASVLLKDYNFQYPTLDMKAQAQVSAKGVGEHYIYGDSFLTQSDGNELAKVRAEELAWKESLFHGETLTPSLSAGYTFTMDDHYDPACNGEYLLVKVKHQARNHAYLSDGVDKVGHPGEGQQTYTNTFTAIPAKTQYRPPRVTPKPRYAGLLTAKVDSSGSGQYAELDDQGRYLIRMPFDLAGRPDGKASCLIRMAQPYAGQNYGMHFPLLKGAEVLIAFVESDPDRPVIAAAIPNVNAVSVVQDKVEPMNMIQSASGNQLVMGDKQNATFLGLYHPKSISGIFMGELDESGTKGKVQVTDNEDYNVVGESSAKLVLGTSNEVMVGFKNEGLVGGSFEANLGIKGEVNVADTVEYVRGNRFEFGTKNYVMENTRHFIANQGISMRSGLPQQIVALEQNALSSVAKMAIANLSGAGSAGSVKELISSDGLWRKNGLTLGLGVGLGTVLGIASGVAIYKSAESLRDMGTQIDNAAHHASVAGMDLDPSGVNITVNTSLAQATDAGLKLLAGNPTLKTENSTISVTNSGKTLSLLNVDRLNLTMTNGQNLNLGFSVDKASKMQMTEKNISVTTGPAYIDLSATAGTTLGLEHGSSLSLINNGATLSGPTGDTTVSCTSTSVTIDAGVMFKVKCTGNATINGELIKIG